MSQSVRAQVIERRTYLRPLNDNGTVFETPEQAWRRVIDHQRWLWERAQERPLDSAQEAELEELFHLFMDRKVTVSGRTRWLGGTAVARAREASQFNCSFGEVQTVNDVVDTIWLLLQGCGVGFRANIGVLNGFACEIAELEIVRSKKVLPKDSEGNPISDPSLKGHPDNFETFNKETGVWHIRVGDSAEAWAKFFGKLFAFKGKASKLIIDFSEIRPAGYRLSGYGWISSGDAQIAECIGGIFEVMNRAAGELLSAIDILDIENHLGTILSSRRSAEIALYPFGGSEWESFATAKKDNFAFFVRSATTALYSNPTESGECVATAKNGEALIANMEGNAPVIQHGFVEVFSPDFRETRWASLEDVKRDRLHRQMSNNSLVFEQKPTRRQLKKIFKLMEEAGGSEPGFINGVEATRRAPYFKGVNPCAEILLGDKSFCNLVETAVCRFNGDEEGLHRAHWLVSRANYRQTCVNLDDGILQRTWHELNEFLHLCGVGVTGVIGWEYASDPDAWEDLRKAAHSGANGMADELGMPHPKLITTIKPSGTQTKVFGADGDEIGEGVHKPLGRYMFNNVQFSKDDPLIPALEAAGYDILTHPADPSGRLVKFPVEYSNIPFDKVTKVVRGEEMEVEVNLETAIDQLDRYKMVQDHYVDHNCSITISYDTGEVPAIIDWLMDNWDSYVGVSFIYRNDPTKTAADLGYAYLPQEVVDEKTFRAYADRLAPVDLSGTDIEEMVQIDDCAGGACPIR